VSGNCSALRPFFTWVTPRSSREGRRNLCINFYGLKGFGRFVVASGSTSARAYIAQAEALDPAELRCPLICPLPLGSAGLVVGKPVNRFCFGYAPNDIVEECAGVMESLLAAKAYKAEERMELLREGLQKIGVRYVTRPRRKHTRAGSAHPTADRN